MNLNKYNFGEDSKVGNPGKGCFQISEACKNCYVKPSNTFIDCYYPFCYSKVPIGTLITIGLATDVFLEYADKYRLAVGNEIKANPNLIFLIITKRVDRILDCLPDDGADGYPNVIFCATIENQQRADERIPVFLKIPAKHKGLTCTPLLEQLDLSTYLATGAIEHVEVSGERHISADHSDSIRETKQLGVEDLLAQCKKYDTRFSLIYLGHNFVQPDGTVLKEHNGWYRGEQAKALNLTNYKSITFELKDITVTY